MQTLWLCNSHDYCRQCIFWKKLELSKGYQLSCREKQQEENSSLFHNPIWATRDMPEMCVWKGNDTSFKEPEIIWCMIIKHNIKIEKKNKNQGCYEEKRRGQHCYFLPWNSVDFLACSFSFNVLSLWAFPICVFFRVYPKYLSVSWPVCSCLSVLLLELLSVF